MSTTTATSTKTLTLWTSSLEMLFTPPGWVGVRDLLNLPNTIEPGNHIIIKDPTTPEAFVLRAIYRIVEAGSNPQVYCSQTWTDYLVQSPLQNGTQLLQQYAEYSIDYRDYLLSLNNQEIKIEIEAARDVAAVILQYSPTPKSDLILLRHRTTLTSYEWRDIVEETKSILSQQSKLNENKIGSGSADSRFGTDSSNPDSTRFTSTVATVTEILNLGLIDYEEQQLLEDIQVKCGLNKNVFWKIVSSQKNKIDSLQPEDEIRLNNLIDWHDDKLDFDKALPSMASDIKHDSDILNIDPIMIWQILLPSVLSQVGTKISLDVKSHKIPCIAWTVTVAESGMGKTRADGLVLSPLRDLQMQYRKEFENKLREWEETCVNLEKGQTKPPKPVETKAMFEVATIQALLRRASEQQPGGQLWNRDEIAGLFKSFGQFSGKNQNEGLEILLKLFDGSPFQNDRVHEEDSYFINQTAVSLSGGIQPGIYRDIFKDPKDSQGLTARMLIATPKSRNPKRVKGYCCLSESLPHLYAWLRDLPEGSIKLSKAAEALYDNLYEEIGGQAYKTSQPAIRAWMIKLMGSNLLRIALGLHFIECYHDSNRPIWELQKDTLERAVLFAQYYRSAFHILQETTTDNDDIASILLKIWDRAATKHPDGITTRDAHRNISAIKYRAKDMGRDTSAYTAELFGMLEAKGKGKVIRSGRTIRFIASIGGAEPPIPDVTPPPQPNSPQPTHEIKESQITPTSVPMESEEVPSNEEAKEKGKMNISNVNAKLTVAIMPTRKESEVSVSNQASVLTVEDSASNPSNPTESVPTEVNVVRDTGSQKVSTEPSNIYVGKECLIVAGGTFDGQGGKIRGYDENYDEYQVISEGVELWFKLDKLQIKDE
jgi:hypothetical protein